MKLYEAFDISLAGRECISIVGAGGKTTALFTLAEELYEEKRKVIITTTTHIFMPEKHRYKDALISTDQKQIYHFVQGIKEPGIYLVGSDISAEQKLVGIGPAVVDNIYSLENIDNILIEADGAKHKSIKAPAEHEPVIPQASTKVIGVIGLDCIGKPVTDHYVHRQEAFCRICACRSDDKIDMDNIKCLINHQQGLFKNTPESAKRYVLLNKADCLLNSDTYRDIGCGIKEGINLVINSFLKDTRIKC